MVHSQSEIEVWFILCFISCMKKILWTIGNGLKYEHIPPNCTMSCDRLQQSYLLMRSRRERKNIALAHYEIVNALISMQAAKRNPPIPPYEEHFHLFLQKLCLLKLLSLIWLKLSIFKAETHLEMYTKGILEIGDMWEPWKPSLFSTEVGLRQNVVPPILVH